MSIVKAAFLDRDGVINVDVGYLHRPQDLVLTEHAAKAMALLVSMGFLLIVVTNQSGIGRGYYEEADFRRLTAALDACLSCEGVSITATYHCPHSLDAGCDCRKPLPGMLQRAIYEHGIDPAHSVMIGDKLSDMAAGRAAGIGRCILVGEAASGEGADEVYRSLWACALCLAGHG